jgi:APA family basic amino acid/polyamine antiporter
MAVTHEANLKRVLGLTDCFGIALGQVVGAGVLVLMGLAIGVTGRGVVLAFLVSSILTTISSLPMAQLASALPTTGASYRYASRLLGPKWGFLWMIGLVLSKITIALYALSFAQYLQGLVPWVNMKTVALTMLTVFYVANVVGMRTAATAEKWMAGCKITALLVFAVWGLPHVEFASFTRQAMFPNGTDGFFAALGLLAFASSGATCVAELGGEMKNPGRDIPLTIIGTTMGIGFFYAAIAFVAAGVLPIADIANKPLTDVARVILPPPLFVFFVVGGALIAMATTINAVFAWVTKGMIIACQDGWLPNSLGAVSKRFGTPHYLLSLFYAIGVITIISGISLAEISKVGLGVLLLVNILPVIACFQLAKKYPEQYQQARFRINERVLSPIVWISAVILAWQAFFLMKDLSQHLLVLIATIMISGLIYVNIVGSNAKFKSGQATGFVEETTHVTAVGTLSEGTHYEATN